MLDANKLKADILSDMRVELSDEFDRNFERKAFFSDKWKPRAHDYPRGSLLICDRCNASVNPGRSLRRRCALQNKLVCTAVVYQFQKHNRLFALAQF